MKNKTNFKLSTLNIVLIIILLCIMGLFIGVFMESAQVVLASALVAVFTFVVSIFINIL